MISRMLQWLWFEATTEVWSPSMSGHGLAPTLRWACTGRDADARREVYSPGEAFRAGMLEAELEALRFELAETRAELERLREAPGQPAVASQLSAELAASLRRVGWAPEVTWLDPTDGYRWSEADEYDMAHLRGVGGPRAEGGEVEVLDVRRRRAGAQPSAPR